MTLWKMTVDCVRRGFTFEAYVSFSGLLNRLITSSYYIS